MFVEPAYRDSDEYRRFWDKLRRGEYDSGRYKRIGQGRTATLWLEASYNPIFGADGKPYKVVKYASDVTAQVDCSAAQMEQAVAQTQDVIKPATDGDLTAPSRLASDKTGDLREMAESINALLASMAEHGRPA